MVGDRGILAGGKVVRLLSSICRHPATVRKLAKEVRGCGLEIVDAQMAGKRAPERQLCFMVGGNREAFEQCRPLLVSSGSNIFHMGELAMG